MSQLEPGGQTVAPEPLPSPWEQPWIPWAIGAGLVLLGILVGWLSTYAVLGPLIRSLPPPVEQPKVGPDQARVEGSIPSARGAPGEQVALQWRITNTGDSTWVVDSYRFVPVGGGARVLALPAPVHPGSTITVVARVEIPPLASSRRLTWQLMGRNGPVPGSILEAVIWSEQPAPRSQIDPTG